MRRVVILLVIAGACLVPNFGPVLEVARTVDVLTLVAGGVMLGLAIAQFARTREQRA